MADPSYARRQMDSRVNVQLTARVSSIDPEKDPESGKRCFRFCEETCTNLSRGGLQIRGAETMEPGRRVMVELEIPGSATFQAVGRVTWSKVFEVGEDESTSAPRPSSGIGIQFTGASRDHFAVLEKFIRTRARNGRPTRSDPGASPPSPGT